MKRYKVYSEETPFYYSTSTIVNWIPVFQKDNYFQIIIDSLKYCQEHKGLLLHGYVIMPTHIHLLSSHSQIQTLPEIMRDFKHFTSSEIIKSLERENHEYYLSLFRNNASNRSRNQQYKVWKDDYHPIAIKSSKWFLEKLTYMHYNPVRKGFVELPEHWKYSSARNWELDDHSIIEIQKLDIVSTVGAEAL